MKLKWNADATRSHMSAQATNQSHRHKSALHQKVSWDILDLSDTEHVDSATNPSMHPPPSLLHIRCRAIVVEPTAEHSCRNSTPFPLS